MLGVFQAAVSLAAACGVFGEEDDAGGGSAEAMDGIGGGALFLDQSQEGVFEEAAAGEGRQAAGFVDGQQMGVFEEDVEVLRGVGFEPGGTVPDEGLAGGERFASIGGDAVDGDFAIVQVLLPSL
jgi:hypothetical protein